MGKEGTEEEGRRGKEEEMSRYFSYNWMPWMPCMSWMLMAVIVLPRLIK